MKLFNINNLIIVLLFITISCNKETPPIDVVPDPPETNDSTYNQYGTPFENVPDNFDVVMYEVNLRAFSSNGDLLGVITRLDEIAALGVNVIWLMPIHPIGEINSVNSPYSVKDYKSVSTEYGTLNDLRKLTDEAHKRDMAVIMDWVANHTGWDNPWIKNKSWYSQDSSGNIIHPPGTNWLDVADLNYTNTDMRLAMIDAMKYWILEANIDGFRCDYADGVPSTFWQQTFDTLSQIPNRNYIFLAEGSRANHFSVGFDMIYAWDFYYKMKDIFNGQNATGLFNTHLSEFTNIPEGKQKLRYTTNHDESAWENTPMVFFKGKRGALSASVSTIFMGGVPLFYTGQEVGRVQKVPFFSNSPINWNENLDMLMEYKTLMNYYTHSEAAKKGSITDYSDNNVLCFKKKLNLEEIVVLANVRNNQMNYSLPDSLRKTYWINALNDEPVFLDIYHTLGSYQYLVLRK